MRISFFNTPDRREEEFKPIDDEKVRLYTCGPTVYDVPHVGNWSSFLAWDTLVRLLVHAGYEVERVMNITDVGHLVSDADEGDDKLALRAETEGKTAWEIADHYIKEFQEGFTDLNMIPATHLARATDFIDEQLDLIRRLKEKGYTYTISDGIYFDTVKFPDYAKFAHLDLTAMKAGARVSYNPEKHNPSDFALWKFTPAGKKRDMEWPTPIDLTDDGDHSSPRGGFPGWHIECSAIALHFLGPTLDIHTGGIDHIPVHHTNEIAQSESATGQRFANYWLHSNHMTISGVKISKSLNNGVTLDDVRQRGFQPLDLRMLLLQHHYRSQGDFTYDGLEAAARRRLNWRNVSALRHQLHDTIDIARDSAYPAVAAATIGESLANDLNTPAALKTVDEAFSRILEKPVTFSRAELIRLLETIDDLLGLDLIKTSPDISEDHKLMIIERNRARDTNDWQTADSIRGKLLVDGIELRDTPDGVFWQYSN